MQVDQLPPLSDPGNAVAQAVHAYFGRRADTARRDLRTLLRRGRTSLVIGLAFLSACGLGADVAGRVVKPSGLASIVQQGLTVAGWAAMWRPMEIFLYAWWPLAGDRRLYDRLRRMPVRVESATGCSTVNPTQG